LARRAESAVNLRIVGLVGGLLVLAVAAIALIFLADRIFGGAKAPEGTTLASGPCLPGGAKQLWLRNRKTARLPKSVQVYFDASGGMQGYVAKNSRVFGNLISQTNNFSRSSFFGQDPVTAEYHTFGEYNFDPAQPKRPTKVTDTKSLSDPATYNEKETKIVDLLNWVIHTSKGGIGAPKPLSIVVTDLMLDDKQATDDFAASVGGRLQELLIRERLAVGFLGVKVAFNGPIYVTQGTAEWGFAAQMRKRPLMILIIGDPYHVRGYYEYLSATKDVAPFSVDPDKASDAHQFSMFSLDASEVERAGLSVSTFDTGFEPVSASDTLPASVAQADLATYAYDTGTDEDIAEGAAFALNAAADLKPYEVVGNDPRWASDVWRLSGDFDPEDCDKGTAWTRVTSLPGRPEVSGDTLSYTLNAGQMRRLRLTDGTYLVQAAAGRIGLSTTDPQSDWMRLWSMPNSAVARSLAQSSQREIGTPGLDTLRNSMLNELMASGRETRWRSASQFIVNVK